MSEALFDAIEKSIRKSLGAGLATARAERDRDIARAAGTCVVHLHKCSVALAELGMTGTDFDPADVALLTATRALVEGAVAALRAFSNPRPRL